MPLSRKTIFLLFTILLSSLYAWPELNFQDLLSQGDHGRDLYAFDAVTHGKLPYKDFWWVYGPLMPYYYGLFFKIFGVHITSVLLGRAVLVVLCSTFFYLAAESVMPAGLAFLAAAWFTQGRQEFFFTYNHIGGVVCELAACWCILAYLKAGRMGYLWGALAAGLILGLVKINFGLAGLAGMALAVLWIDGSKKYPFDQRKKAFYLGAGLAVPFILLFIHWLLLRDLPLYAIRQCMPYFGDDQPYHASPLVVIPYYLTQHWLTLVRTPFGILIGVVLHGCTLWALYLLIFRRIEAKRRQEILLALATASVFFVVYFHEFLVSAVWYRSYWAAPFLVLLHFIMIAAAFLGLPKFLRILIPVVLWEFTFLGFVAHIGILESQKTADHYLNMDRGRIFVGNEVPWVETVNSVTNLLNTSLKDAGPFFALPYDCLYYYLAGQESPTRQLIFFDHIKIPPQQEISVIGDLEKSKVNFVLMSNRIISDEKGLGVFGTSYCPLISRYLHDHFSPVARQGGHWNQPPGWANNHGVVILRRKTVP